MPSKTLPIAALTPKAGREVPFRLETGAETTQLRLAYLRAQSAVAGALPRLGALAKRIGIGHIAPMAADKTIAHMRPLDHCVLPTASLKKVRARLGALGFTVAPTAVHPFGTGNCCVFFRDGAYLEPLAIVDEDAVRAAAEQENTFVRRDRAYRDAHGEEGFSALVIGTRDAEADHARFAREGISAGSALCFSRPFIDSAGLQAEAFFRLAFAAPAGSQTLFFACERVRVPALDRSSLVRHENGVTGIASLLATAPEPNRHAAFLASFFGSAPCVHEHGAVEVGLANARLSVFAPDEARRVYGIACAGENGLRLCGVVFRTPNLAVLRERLAAAGFAFAERRGQLIVLPAPGQGAYFIFEEPEA